MNESDQQYEDDFRKWFHEQIRDHEGNARFVAAFYRPLYNTYLAGAANATQRITERIRNMPA